jgi:hypothetical protein
MRFYMNLVVLILAAPTVSSAPAGMPPSDRSGEQIGEPIGSGDSPLR